MKRIIRHIIIDATSLYLVSLIAKGMEFENGAGTFMLTALCLTAVTIFAKPVINLLLLPLNLVTFGLFRWVSSAIALFIVELVIPKFNITHFYFPGYFNKWIEIPTLQFNGVMEYIAFAFILSIITSVMYWVAE